jgi:hypothetical protein
LERVARYSYRRPIIVVTTVLIVVFSYHYINLNIRESAEVPFNPPGKKDIKVINSIDLVEPSLSKYSESSLSLDEANSILKNHGKMLTAGMSYESYENAMKLKWEDETDYFNKPSAIDIDLESVIDNNKYYEILKILSRHEGVYLYKIGESVGGLPLYSISIDYPSKDSKRTFLFTGQIHSREFAGGVFLLKMFTDLIQKAATDKQISDMLRKVKYVAVPIVSLDVRQKIIESDQNYIRVQGELWKESLNGVDLNRNFPGINAGMLSYTNRYSPATSAAASLARGPYFGCNPETQALMKWLFYYIIHEQAVYYADFHQQGMVMYSGKPWDTKDNEERYKNIALSVLSFMNAGNWPKYRYIPEKPGYGLEGEGSTITDYAVSIAMGAKFSKAFGVCVIPDESRNKEYTLLHIKDLDNSGIKLKRGNDRFVAATYEIGYGDISLGYSQRARRLHAQEYEKYRYGKLLEVLPELVK